MPAGRPPIPAKLQRAVLLEAGHRCALPGCGATNPVLAHIKPWAKVKKHDFENLIALCPNCHARFDRGDIDRQSMLQYKANLAVMNSRYSDVERRVLTYFAMHPDADEVDMPGGMHVLLMYLLRDGYIDYGTAFTTRATPDGFYEFDIPMLQTYRLTETGREFVKRWRVAADLSIQ